MPQDRVSWHNLAAAEGDLGHAEQAEAAARRAIALGIPAPETRLVLARALQIQRRLDDAERAFLEAIRLRPDYADAHRDLAQLLWMRSADAAAALRHIERALRAAPANARLHHVKSVVLEYAGLRADALGAVEAGLSRAPADVQLLAQAAHLCVDSGQWARALELAQRAVQLAPGAGLEVLVCEALVVAGRLAEADALAAQLRRMQPLNQYALALQAIVWRLRGDPRHAALCDYDRFVTCEQLDLPQGWATMDSFLAEVAAELDSLHAFRTHPLQQSVRGGSQLSLHGPELARRPIAALFESIGAAVERYLARLGKGTDPLRSRNTGRFAISAWSVRLSSGGYHADHVHPEGWVSSACYIRLPPTLGAGAGDRPDRAGWLRLGKPNIPTQPPLDPERYVQPVPGRLVLFPAYVLHGVEPFESDQPRLSVAFDATPI